MSPLKNCCWVLLLILLLSGGCAAPGNPMILRGIVENAMTTVAEDVVVVHLPTGATATMSTIHPGQRAEVSFSPRALLAESAEISWVEQRRRMKVDLVIPGVEDDSQGVMELVYRLHSRGRVTAELRPVTAE